MISENNWADCDIDKRLQTNQAVIVSDDVDFLTDEFLDLIITGITKNPQINTVTCAMYTTRDMYTDADLVDKAAMVYSIKLDVFIPENLVKEHTNANVKTITKALFWDKYKKELRVH